MKKVTLNLFSDDVVAMEKKYGWGWTSVVRELVKKHLKGAQDDKGSTDSWLKD